jgi:Ca2+/H+ antiporter
VIAGEYGEPMKQLLKEIRHNPLLWLLAFVPFVLVAAKLKPEEHTWLFVLSVLAIVPLATLLSHATESVAAKTGDSVGGLLNATLGNLTELVIALAALRAGQIVLVKASIAGAIVTNTLFMLGAFVSSRRPQTSHSRIQPDQRSHTSRVAISCHDRAAVVMILVATLTATLVTNTGRSAWFIGVLVLMVYLIFAMTLYLLPSRVP